jgi:hypothetical protein
MPPEPPAPAASPPPAIASVDVLTDEPPMSFETWLESMGADEPQAAAIPASPAIASADTPVAEPSEDSNDSRPRATYELPEKPRERTVVRKTSGRLAAMIAAGFAVGALFGALAMRSARSRTRAHARGL